MPRYNPRIRIFPPDDGDKPHAPPFEFYWTNRVVYPPDLLPEQSPGCDCEGRCQDPENIDSCACRKRQIEVCKTRADSKYDRSEHKGFAYNEGGQIVPEMLPEPEPVWCARQSLLFPSFALTLWVPRECNSHCECDDGCINRVRWVVSLSAEANVVLCRSSDSKKASTSTSTTRRAAVGVRPGPFAATDLH